MQVGGLPDVDLGAGVGEQLGVPAGLGHRVVPAQVDRDPASAARRAARGPARATGAPKLPGTCSANQAPAGSAASQRGSSRGCVGTHCSTALVTTTSVSGCGVQSTTSACWASIPALPGGGDHLRRGVQRVDRGRRPARGEQPGQVPGTAAEVDDAARGGRRRSGRAGRGTGGRGGRRSSGRASGPSWCVTVGRSARPPSGCGATIGGDLGAPARPASVPGSGRTCSTMPSRPGTLRCTNHAPPPGRSRWCAAADRRRRRGSCTVSGTRPGSTSRSRRGGRSVSSTAPSTTSDLDGLDHGRARPSCQVALLTRCQPTRRAPPSARAATARAR